MPDSPLHEIKPVGDLERCMICERVEAALICAPCRATLKALVENVKPIDHPIYSTIELRNVRFSSDIHGAEATVAIDSDSNLGVQRPIGIDGSAKCTICDEFVESRMICPLCEAAVRAMRQLDAVTLTGLLRLEEQRTQIEDLLVLANQGGLLTLLQALGNSAVRAWIEKEIRDLE